MSRIQAETPIMLEQEIVAALADADINSTDLSALIERTEAAIAEADQAAETARGTALDPALSPDAKSAREAMVAAEFDRDRLHTLLPRLQERLLQVQAAEYAARWQADFEQVEGQRNELAQECAATYPRIVAQLVDLFERIEAADKEVSRINGSAPSGEHRRLRQVELVARGLNNFTRADPPITKAVQLADWTHSERLIWPRSQPSLAAVFAMSMVPPHGPHYTADWAAELEKDNVRRAATEARWAEQEAARQEESRRAYEASLRR
jgi:predicted transcriptional regulator